MKRNGCIYIQSKLLLKNGFIHAFFTKINSNKTPKGLSKLFNSDMKIHLLNQVHGEKVIIASDASNKKKASADSIISNKSDQSLWLYTADCIPILLADTKKGFVAAIHSGWKGLTLNIIKKTLEKLEFCGCQRADLIFALGPSISGIHYPVNEDIVNAFLISINANTRYNHNIDLFSFKDCISINNSIPFLDIRKAAKRQLLLEGISSKKICLNSECTYANSNLFNSWRRNQTKNRQWSFIVSKRI
ncbi:MULTISPECIES: peptidoglycan editing factor PgeF [unclassified Prochlorococcus]|uniref:peptidoglycan editing factor PgeF n=1 Tax=unclassified Prochlorococcus TaxID=2627481 RepID=UPI000533759B|nr:MULTISPECIES: peptidoglycan editing factor PgeF [unclassified Prochlorococcus]KGG17096.1 hypothetical protein EV07_0527 [Prochlorococcus sp. MIT 0603]